MRQLIITLALVLSFIASDSQAYNGNDALKDQRGNSQFRKGFLLGSILQAGDNALINDDETDFCIPDDDGMTQGQIHDVIMQYIKRHPAERHKGIAPLAYLAFMEAWPCNNKPTADLKGQDPELSKELIEKFRRYYSTAPEEKLDEFMTEQAEAMSAALPHKINEATELYKIAYIAEQNTLMYAYEIDGSVLGLTKEEVIDSAEDMKRNMKQHHITSKCSYPTSRLFMDLGIKMNFLLMAPDQTFITAYTLTTEDCLGASLIESKGQDI